MLGPAAESVGAKFRTVLDESLSTRPDAKEALVSSYEAGDGAGSLGFLYFAHDVLQLAATRAIAKRWPGTAHVYHFNEPNPWDGRFKGVASHLLDTAFLFQNYEEFLSEEQASVGRTFARHVIEFVNGEEPYGAFSSGSGKVHVYGPGGSRSREVDAHDFAAAGRRDHVFRLAEEAGLARLTEIVHETLRP